MEKKTWENRELNTDEINVAIDELEEQILAFELQVRYEEKQVAFREVYMEWYESRITLGELLDAMMKNGLCQRISPFLRS